MTTGFLSAITNSLNVHRDSLLMEILYVFLTCCMVALVRMFQRDNGANPLRKSSDLNLVTLNYWENLNENNELHAKPRETREIFIRIYNVVIYITITYSQVLWLLCTKLLS